MRTYEKEVKGERGRMILNKGLKKVHIGDDVWVYGRHKKLDNVLHMVIYGPNRKEYDVYGKDVTTLITADDSDHYDFWGYCNRQGNRGIQAKVKIHILTSILDKKDNWCYDLSIIPQRDILKVIYDNGMVRNIEFDGVFTNAIMNKNGSTYKYDIKPVAYRL